MTPFAETCDRLLAIAGFLDLHGEALAEVGVEEARLIISDTSLAIFLRGDGQREACAALAREVGGRWDKRETSVRDSFILERELVPGVKVQVWTDREAVCERVVVGTETVEVPDPDFEAPTVTVEREVVEWRCESLLSGGLLAQEEATA